EWVKGIWGGSKQSGMGRELGYHGLDDFIEIKQIFTDGTGLAMKPPYGQVIKHSPPGYPPSGARAWRGALRAGRVTWITAGAGARVRRSCACASRNRRCRGR